MDKTDVAAVLDISKWPNAQAFVARAGEFLHEIEDL
jgi:hypothetical protein